MYSMKTYFFIISILTSSLLFAGNGDKISKETSTKLVSGKVIDKVSGEEIAGAEIKIDGKTIYTDLNGHFLTNIHLSATKAVVSSLSYNDANLTIAPFSYSELVIELESK
jgi:hypothetical protein